MFPVAKDANEVLVILKDIPKDSIIFIDIDDTIITPVSKAFRKAPYKELIDDIKNNKNQYQNYEEIVSNWRLQRKIMLMDSNWPNVLIELKNRYKTYGLTKMDTGKFGNIESMEKWRYRELNSLGIKFSDEEDGWQSAEVLPNYSQAVFYKGIFSTGPNSKSQAISYYLKYLKADAFVMIDDRKENLEDIKQFCQKKSIKFVGILFSGMEKFNDTPNEAVFFIQKKYLIEHAKWLEDEEAEKLNL